MVMLSHMEKRFTQKFERSEGCWLWRGAIDRGGYGVFSIGSRTDGSRKMVKAHRVAYELLAGPIPAGLELDHKCRNRSCVNPDHLEPVTGPENTRRGEGISVKNARKTHCKAGHAFDELNTSFTKQKHRVCLACQRIAVKSYKQRMKI
jgi:hypothetical protein